LERGVLQRDAWELDAMWELLFYFIHNGKSSSFFSATGGENRHHPQEVLLLLLELELSNSRCCHGGYESIGRAVSK
jgi:hypothetical protein